MNYNLLINFLALDSDSDTSKIVLMDDFVSVLKKHYSVKELSIYFKILIEKLNSKVSLFENHLSLAVASGASDFAPYEFMLDNEKYSKDIFLSIKIWKFAVVYLEELAKKPELPKLTLNFDTLPDFIKPAQLTELIGWTESTIATKHSKGELACVEGTRLTPKQGLKDYLEKKTKGLIDKPDEWFRKKVMIFFHHLSICFITFLNQRQVP